MKTKIIILLLFGFSIVTKAQIMFLDSIPKNYFNKYDVIFLGEYHEAKQVEKTQEKFIQLFKTDYTKVLLEKRYDFNFLYQDFFIKRDTSEFSGYYIKEDRDFARFIYQNRISVKAIDILRVNDLFHDPVLKIFDSKRTSLERQQAVDAFIHSGGLNFSGGRRSIKDNSYFFLEKWDSVKTVQKIILGIDSTFVEGYFEALRAALLTSDDKTTKTKFASIYRERFMLSMIEQELKKDTTTQLISINGLAHVFLNDKDKWVKSKTYEPLAKLTKEKFPNKKICSIYLFNWSTDKIFNKLYPKELSYILQNTELGKTYLIDPDFEGSPIKKLKENFTYVLVY